MMWKPQTLYARTSALPAIAAAMALSSTSALAQEAQPVQINPPPVTQPSTTTTDTAPATPTTTTETAAPDTATQTAAPTTAHKVMRTTRTTRTTTARPAPAPVTHTVIKTTTTHAAVPAATPVAAAKPAPAPAAPAQQSAVNPVVDMSAKPAPASTTATAKPTNKDDTMELAGGGALALLILGGGAYALSRRRRRVEEEEWTYDEPVAHEPYVEPEMHHEPVLHEEQPAIVAPSAFAWGNEPKAAEASDEDDRLPGETWIQRAYRGPTPNNPSVSLKARLKRAAFFDKRERDVAAGKAEPVDMDAGLPEAMVEEQEQERELA